MMATQPVIFKDFCDCNIALHVLGISTNVGRIKAINRIGPHNKEVLSYIIGGMLGDYLKSRYFSTTSLVSVKR